MEKNAKRIRYTEGQKIKLPDLFYTNIINIAVIAVTIKINVLQFYKRKRNIPPLKFVTYVECDVSLR